MKISTADIYYNDMLGYIVTSYTKYVTGGPDRVMNPVVQLMINATNEEIGKCVLEGLEKTRTAKRVTPEELKGYNFWEASGIKSYKTFNKKYRLVTVAYNEGIYSLAERKQSLKGGYEYSKNDITYELVGNVSVTQLGKKIVEILSNQEVLNSNHRKSFETLNGSNINYSFELEGFEDIGDGHTDAYQVYRSSKDEYVSFMIDSGYKTFKVNDIKLKWEMWFPTMIDLKYTKSIRKEYAFMVTAKNENMIIKSYFFKDCEFYLELMVTYLEGSKVALEIEKMIDSIKVEKIKRKE